MQLVWVSCTYTPVTSTSGAMQKLLTEGKENPIMVCLCKVQQGVFSVPERIKNQWSIGDQSDPRCLRPVLPNHTIRHEMRKWRWESAQCTSCKPQQEFCIVSRMFRWGAGWPQWRGIPSNFHDELSILNGLFLRFWAVPTRSKQPLPGPQSPVRSPTSHLTPSCLPCRITGFKLSLGVLALLIVLAVLGLASRFLDEYLDLHVAKKLRHPF